MRTSPHAALLLAAACASSAESGTGSGTLEVHAQVTSQSEIQNSQSPVQFTTEYRVDVWRVIPGFRSPAPNAVVNLRVGSRRILLANQALQNRPERFTASEGGFLPEDVVRLDVDVPNPAGGDDFVHGVSRQAPGLHVFTRPSASGQSVPYNVPFTVTWNRPDPADLAELELEKLKSPVPDSGSYAFAANVIETQAKAGVPCRLDRTNTVLIAGAAPTGSSELDLRVRQSLEVNIVAQ